METPGQLADRLLEIAEESSRFSGELIELLQPKPEAWTELRKLHQSDKATDVAWDMTEHGRREMWLKMRIKSNDRLSSAIKTKLRILENEARNIY